MKKTIILLIALSLCLTLCSCDSLIHRIKAIAKGEDYNETVSEVREGFIETKKNELFEYNVFNNYIEIKSYIGEESEVDIPNEIDGKPVARIGSLAFYEGEEITSVTIPNSVVEIDSQAFYYCTELVSLVIPSSVETIGARAFSWCSGLEAVYINAKITKIPDYCFNSCTALSTVTIPSTVTEIGDRAFSWCISLTSLTLSKNVAKIGANAFFSCYSLALLTVPSSETVAEKNAFLNCSSLMVVTPTGGSCYCRCIEDGIKTIAKAPVIPGETSGDTSSAVSE